MFGKQLANRDGRKGYCTGKNPTPGYFNVRVWNPETKKIEPEAWHGSAIVESSLLRALGLETTE
jgi:hypothetical protein